VLLNVQIDASSAIATEITAIGQPWAIGFSEAYDLAMQLYEIK